MIFSFFLDQHWFANLITRSFKWPYSFQFVTDKEYPDKERPDRQCVSHKKNFDLCESMEAQAKKFKKYFKSKRTKTKCQNA